jgi:ribosome-binding protein aMBF1 (putative translation factor)
MTTPSHPCQVCGPEGSGKRTRRVVVDGHEVFLCSRHAAQVRAHAPATFEQLQALFRPEGEDRRSPIPRRSREDRRYFPPRPEGRRRGAGRRATDSTG